MRTGLLYLMACSFMAGWYCANNDVSGELKELYDGLVDYTAARAAQARRIEALDTASNSREAQVMAGGRL